MELSTATQIVETLARGVHPVTGEAMPSDSPYNQPPVIRALFTVARALSCAGADSQGSSPPRRFSVLLNLNALNDKHATAMIKEMANRAEDAATGGHLDYSGMRGNVEFDMHSIKEHNR